MIRAFLSLFHRSGDVKTPEMVSVEARINAAEARIKREDSQYTERLRDKRLRETS